MKDDTVQLISVAANTTGSERIGVLTLTGYCRVGTSTFRKVADADALRLGGDRLNKRRPRQ